MLGYGTTGGEDGEGEGRRGGGGGQGPGGAVLIASAVGARADSEHRLLPPAGGGPADGQGGRGSGDANAAGILPFLIISAAASPAICVVNRRLICEISDLK